MYIPNSRFGGSQNLLRRFTEELNQFYPSIPVRCRDIATRVLCTHYYLPCGFNGTLHVPLPLCPDVCRYMSETLCPDVWSFTTSILNSTSEYRNENGTKLPACNNTDKLIDFLNLTSDCCSDGGVLLPRPTVTGNCTVIKYTTFNDSYHLFKLQIKHTTNKIIGYDYQLLTCS